MNSFNHMKENRTADSGGSNKESQQKRKSMRSMNHLLNHADTEQ